MHARSYRDVASILKHGLDRVPLVVAALPAVASAPRLLKDIHEILEDRYGVRSTIVTSQLAPEKWPGRLGEATLADASVDRLRHGAYRIALKGPWKRKEKAAV